MHSKVCPDIPQMSVHPQSSQKCPKTVSSPVSSSKACQGPRLFLVLIQHTCIQLFYIFLFSVSFPSFRARIVSNFCPTNHPSSLLSLFNLILLINVGLVNFFRVNCVAGFYHNFSFSFLGSGSSQFFPTFSSQILSLPFRFQLSMFKTQPLVSKNEVHKTQSKVFSTKRKDS